MSEAWLEVVEPGDTTVQLVILTQEHFGFDASLITFVESKDFEASK